MLNRQPVNSLKGIGEKTGKLFEKLGVVTIDDLLSYYPRAYDAYEPPVSIGQLKEQAVMAVESALVRELTCCVWAICRLFRCSLRT